MKSKLTWKALAAFANLIETIEEYDYQQLCINSAALEYYFEVKKSKYTEGNVNIYVMPKAYWDKHGVNWKVQMRLNHLLPDELENNYTNVWSIKSDNIDLIEQDMLQRGFLKNESFSLSVKGPADVKLVEEVIEPASSNPAASSNPVVSNQKLTWDMITKWSIDRSNGIEDSSISVCSEEYDELCNNSVASDFYFEVQASEEPGMVDVYVTPKLYFDAVGEQWDQHTGLEHLLPPETFDCVTEGVWCVEGDLHTVNADLIQRGFLKNETFSEIVLSTAEDLDDAAPDTTPTVKPHTHDHSCSSGCSHNHTESEEPKVLTEAEKLMKKIQDLPFTDEMPEEERQALVFNLIKAEFNLEAEELTTKLSSYLQDNAEKLTLDMMNIAPHGDYSKMLHNEDDMAQFLKAEAHEIKNWKLSMISPEHKLNLLRFEFMNTAVDDGNSLKGMVYVSYQGKVRHAFAQTEL